MTVNRCPSTPSQPSTTQLLWRGESVLPLCSSCHKYSSTTYTMPGIPGCRGSAVNKADKNTCTQRTDSLPSGKEQVTEWNTQCVRWWRTLTTKIKLGGERESREPGWPGDSPGRRHWIEGQGEGEAGKCLEKSAPGRGWAKSWGRKGPASLWHNRRPPSSQQSEWGRSEAKERPERPERQGSPLRAVEAIMALEAPSREQDGKPTAKGHALRPNFTWDARLLSGGHKTWGQSVKSKKKGSGKPDTGITAEGTWRCLAWGRRIYWLLQRADELSQEVIPFTFLWCCRAQTWNHELKKKRKKKKEEEKEKRRGKTSP